MGKYVRLVYVTINNPDNCSKYIPIIRKFNGDSLGDIRENIANRKYVISFDWDKSEYDFDSRNKFISTLKNLISAGAELSLFKDFYNKSFDKKTIKEILLQTVLEEPDTLDIEEHLRTPIKMKQLIQFPKDKLEQYAVYTNSKIDTINADTIFYVDDTVEVDDEDNEIYPLFAQENNLLIYFLGFQMADIISNTKHQLDYKKPSVDDYIKNFNNYSEYDCYFSF